MRVREKALKTVLIAIVLCLSVSGPATSGERKAREEEKEVEHDREEREKEGAKEREVERDEESQHLHEGAITITGEGIAETMKVLGGELGRKTVIGVDVGLFVLQAESPERLRPGARGPTHVFNLTFLDADKGGSVKEIQGTLIVDGPGEPRRVPFRPYEAHHQAVARLEEEGEYKISVEFVAGDRKGLTPSFPFHYHRKKSKEEHEH
jgi:hypothetical protein